MLTTGMFRNRWWIVFGSVLGLMVNTGVITVFTFAVFLKPITETLGIPRATIGAALIIGSLCSMVATPLFGKAIDYFGLRAVHLPMICAFALATAAMSLLQMPFVVIAVLFGLHGLLGSGQSPVAYSKAIAAWFDRDRGLALGIAIAGVGLGVVVVPQIASHLIANFGWRAAYVGLAIAIIVFALVPATLFVREPPTQPERAQAQSGEVAPGATLSQALFGGWRFWAMAIAFFFVVVAVNGTLTQVVAMLTDRGVPLKLAVGALSSAGLALTVGRIISGICLDRIHGPYVATFFFLAAIAGIALLASAIGGAVPLVGTVLCGLGIGAEVDLMAFFVSRYFGLRSFGAIYGAMFALFSLGNGVGPFLMGYSFDHTHSYVPMMLIFEVALAIACLLLLPLGPYRFAAKAHRPVTAR